MISNGSRRWKALDASVSCGSASLLFFSGDGAVSVFSGDCIVLVVVGAYSPSSSARAVLATTRGESARPSSQCHQTTRHLG